MPMTQVSILTALDHIDRAIRFRFGVIEAQHLPVGQSSYPTLTTNEGHINEDTSPDHLTAARHIKYVVDEARRMVLDHSERRETIMRRLAFCQGWLWSLGLSSIDELKDSNRPPDE